MRDFGLPEESWMALKAEYETGILANQELAKKYGITPKAITYRAKREGWTRLTPEQSNVVKIEIGRRIKKAVESPDHIPLKRGPVEEMVSPEKRALLREVAVEHAIRTMAEATTTQLQRAADLKVVFNDFAQLIRDVLTGDEAVAGKAAERILSSPTANIATSITALVGMAEKIQRMERLALGIDQSPNHVGLSGQRDANPLVLTNDSETGMPVIDVSSLPSAQLTALRELAALTDATRSVELPKPPRSP
jgi:hypothetical protein